MAVVYALIVEPGSRARLKHILKIAESGDHRDHIRAAGDGILLSYFTLSDLQNVLVSFISESKMNCDVPAGH